MKVLLSHNFYRSSAPSGEDAAFRNERALLEGRGVEVVSFERFNDDIGAESLAEKLGAAAASAWSRRSYRELSALIRSTRPKVAHFHNTFPQLSPSAYAACRDNGVPVVQTLHNYRLVCPGAMLLREGRPCEDCSHGNLLPALRHRCYRNSLLATGAVVWMLTANRVAGNYRSLVDRYIALTEFAAGRLAAGGLPRARISVKPNVIPEVPVRGNGGGGYAVYVGRLAAEKGVRTLLAAWERLPGVPLKLLGDGPLRGELEGIARGRGLPVEFLGYRPREEMLAWMAGADLLVLPSETYEGFPVVLLEAFACGTPVVASRIGSVDEIVEEGVSGVKFAPGNAGDLAGKVEALWADAAGRAALRHRARATYEHKYTAAANFTQLMHIYAEAIEHFGTGRAVA